MTSKVTLTFAGDANQLERTFGKVGKAANKMQGNVERTSKKSAGALGNIAKKAGLVAGAVAAIGIGGAIKLGGALLSTADDASDLNESMSKVEAVFGSASGEMKTFADNAAKSLGLSKSAALEASGTFGNMFDQLGIGADASAKMSQEIIGLSADFASFNNADISDVIDAQSAAFRGEFDSLQQFLPLINAANVEQKALAQTGKASTKELTQQDKALAVHALMLEGAGQAQGDFAKTSDGLANSQRIAEAEMANMRAEIGQRMLPVAKKLNEIKLKVANAVTKKLVPALDKASGFLKDNRETFEKIGAVIMDTVLPAVGDIASEIGSGLKNAVKWLVDHKDTWIEIGNAIADVAGPAFEFVGDAIMAIVDNKDALLAVGIGIAAVLVPAFVSWAISAGAAAVATLVALAPIILIGAAVAGLAFLIISNWDWIKEKTETVWNGIKEVLSTVWDAIEPIVQAGIDYVSSAIEVFLGLVTGDWGRAWDGIKGMFSAVWDGIKAILDLALGGVKDSLSGAWDAIKGVAEDAWNGLKDGISGTLDSIVSTIGGLGGRITSSASGAFNGVWTAFKKPINKIIEGWNNLSFSVPSVTVLGKTFGGQKIGTPNIPKLARGAIVTAPTLAFIGEAGRKEAVTPLPPGPGHGGLTGGGVAQLLLGSDGSDIGDVLLTMVRQAIRNSGGTVQEVLG